MRKQIAAVMAFLVLVGSLGIMAYISNGHDTRFGYFHSVFWRRIAMHNELPKGSEFKAQIAKLNAQLPLKAVVVYPSPFVDPERPGSILWHNRAKEEVKKPTVKPNPEGQKLVQCKGPMRGWRLAVDQTDARAFSPSKNPTLREALYSMDSELPLRIAKVD